MPRFEVYRDKKTKEWVIKTSSAGQAMLAHSLLNYGDAFTAEHRDTFELYGLLPAEVQTITEQLGRAEQLYRTYTSDIKKHVFLRSLQDRNETLFYRFILNHITELLPIIYTPVVGEACQNFHRIYKRARGLFISYPDRHRMDEMLAAIDLPDVKIIVVSDGERILGIGDQGVGGMGIPIGKVVLYTVCGGVHPAFGLPIILDVGTNNQERLDDPLYFGWRHNRITGKEYDDFIDLFVQGVKKRFPNAILQWEDFAKNNAYTLLERYKNECCSFNDDIQGTAAVALAGLLAASKVKNEKLSEQRMVILGAGSAGSGIAEQISAGMQEEGLSENEANARIYLVDIEGLITEDMSLTPSQTPFAKPISMKGSFKETIVRVKPTILLGVSTAHKAFNEEIVKEMAKHVERPIIFPLSNPLSKAEAEPQDLYAWTNGKAIVATGTKYPDVTFDDKIFQVGQCNNCYIFPAIGLGSIAINAKKITNGMFLAAAKALANHSPALQDENKSLFPSLESIRNVTKEIALSVAKEAQKEGLAPLLSEEETKALIEENFWEPHYAKLERKR